MWFPNRPDSNRPVQSQKMARDWKFWIQKVEELYYPVAKTKALISFAVTLLGLVQVQRSKCIWSKEYTYPLFSPMQIVVSHEAAQLCTFRTCIKTSLVSYVFKMESRTMPSSR